jgi:dTDP-4-dehydrorhamnose 3,5-epimerase
METIETGFEGLLRMRPPTSRDARGLFVKTFHEQWHQALGISFVIREEFYSISAKGVLRGMHFQAPPAAHSKMVYCLRGRVLDVCLDMRRNSPRFGQAFACELNVTDREVLFIPPGFAHGFASLEDDSLMVYKTDVVHTPELDRGILWDSFGFKWPFEQPILSNRDRSFQRWNDFTSPF